MLSKLIKQKIQERFGREIRYPKDCELLATHITQACKTQVSASTVKRLYGFVKGIREPRLHTLDIVAEYVGHKTWTQLLTSMDKTGEPPTIKIERLKPEQVKRGQTVQLVYEPGKQVEIKRTGGIYKIVVSNDRRLQLNDEVEFRLIELHYPLILTVTREGRSLGKVQVAMVSGITEIRKN